MRDSQHQGRIVVKIPQAEASLVDNRCRSSLNFDKELTSSMAMLWGINCCRWTFLMLRLPLVQPAGAAGGIGLSPARDAEQHIAEGPPADLRATGDTTASVAGAPRPARP